MAEPTPSRIGVIRIVVDGDWDMENLRELSEGMSESYGLFFPLVAQEENTRETLQDILRKQFWSGDMNTRHFGRYLYQRVPREESLKLKSFRYASLGAMEISGVLVVLLLLSRVARAWIATAGELISLWERVEKYFEKRKHLRKPEKEIELDTEMSSHSDEARKLVFELGEKLGFDALSCEKTIEVLGNPISALKYLVAVGNEGRKLAELERIGLLQLPAVGGEAIVIQSSGSKRRTRGGVVVETRRNRKTKS